MTSARLALLLFAACAASPWQPPANGMPTGWRDHEVFYGIACTVVASDASGAREAHDLVAGLAAATQVATSRPAPRVLVLALGFDDPLPITPADVYVATLVPLHERATGTPRPIRDLRPPRTEDGHEVEIDPSWHARLLAFAMPRDDETLGLPAELRGSADCVVILPTTSCIEAVADAMLDAGLDAKGTSFFQRALIAPFRGKVIAPLTEKLEEQVRIALVAAMLPSGSCDEEQLAEVCRIANLSPDAVRGRSLPATTAAEVDELQRGLARVRAAKHDGRLGAAPPATGVLLETYCSLRYTHIVDLSPAANDRFAAAAAAAGKHYTHLPLPCSTPDRTIAEALAAALPKESNARVLVVGATDDQAPLVLAAHAFWVAGVDRAAATDAALELGAVDGVVEFAQSLEPPREQRRR